MSRAERTKGGATPRRHPREPGFTSAWRSAEFRIQGSVQAAPGSQQPCRGHGGRSLGRNGFTLIEMLVALAIFSLAALALLRLEGATVTNTARLQDQALAQIVARNIAVEAMTDPMPPPFGRTSGTVANAGRNWTWVRSVDRSPEPRIQMISIAVSSQAGPEAANLTIFRRAAQ